jgi:hypothetical protein
MRCKVCGIARGGGDAKRQACCSVANLRQRQRCRQDIAPQPQRRRVVDKGGGGERDNADGQRGKERRL